MDAISDKHDFIVFKPINGDFPNYLYGFDSMYRGQKYYQMGVDQQRQPIWKEGVISKKKRMFNFLFYGY